MDTAAALCFPAARLLPPQAPCAMHALTHHGAGHAHHAPLQLIHEGAIWGVRHEQPHPLPNDDAGRGGHIQHAVALVGGLWGTGSRGGSVVG